MTRRSAVVAFISAAAVATIVAAPQPAAPPDTILVNGHVITVDARFSMAEAIAIAGGKFSAVGTNEGIELLLNRIAKTDTNAQFLGTLTKTLD